MAMDIRIHAVWPESRADAGLEGGGAASAMVWATSSFDVRDAGYQFCDKA
jgi:hypothetical protein